MLREFSPEATVSKGLLGLGSVQVVNKGMRCLDGGVFLLGAPPLDIVVYHCHRCLHL